MEWSQVINEPVLQNLPYKVELNEWGQITLSPASNKHGMIQAELSGFLREHKTEGKVITECSVRTYKGVKVADVSWGSAVFFQRNGFDTPYPEAPELCAEIISPSNTTAEIEEKISLYLSKGAKEVWVCDEEGCMKIYTCRGETEKSLLFPHIPEKIDF